MSECRSTFRSYVYAQASVVFVATVAAAVPASAASRPCSEPESIRGDASEAMSTVNVANSRSTPLTIEWVDAPGAATSFITLSPGESKLLQAIQGYVVTSHDARRRCLSKFVPEKESETWEIATTLEGDYQRTNIGPFPVYVAPEFTRDHALLERCLQALESNVKRIQEVLPAAAREKLSGIPIWLEYEPDKSYGGAYFASEDWLALEGVTRAKAKSIQFTSSLAVVSWGKANPLMHEIAHAYHDLVLSLSYPPIWSAYQHANLGGRYNAVRHSSGRFERAYAMRDHAEFFAELSEAYFGYSDFFPFTREDLKEFDPGSYRVISTAWERPFEKKSTGWDAWPLRRPK
jgi:hypothetical protein